MAVHSKPPITPPIPQRVEAALKQAARITGADFDYLVQTAARESGFRTRVKAPTSSATGLFQFIESTWLGMVKEHGAEFGLGKQAQAISKTSNGRYVVADTEQRKAILELRKNPEIASVMAGVFTRENANYLTTVLKRQPTAGELYIAHFLGAGNGSRLVKAAELKPAMKADDLFPQAAKANPSLFYRKGQAVSVKGLYQNLVRRHGALTRSQELTARLDQPGEGAAAAASLQQQDGFKGVQSWSRGLTVTAFAPAPPGGVDHALKVADLKGGMMNEGAGHPGEKNGGDGPLSEGRAGQIGIWGAGHSAPIAEGGGALRQHKSLAAAAAREKQAPLLDFSGDGLEKAKGLFQKGGLGRMKG